MFRAVRRDKSVEGERRGSREERERPREGKDMGGRGR